MTFKAMQGKEMNLPFTLFSSSEASLFHRKAGSAGMMGRGKRIHKTFFPLPIIPSKLPIFQLLLFSFGYPVGASADVCIKFKPVKAIENDFIGEQDIKQKEFY